MMYSTVKRGCHGREFGVLAAGPRRALKPKPRSVYKLLGEGRIPSVRLGYRIVIPKKALEKFLMDEASFYRGQFDKDGRMLKEKPRLAAGAGGGNRNNE